MGTPVLFSPALIEFLVNEKKDVGRKPDTAMELTAMQNDRAIPIRDLLVDMPARTIPSQPVQESHTARKILNALSPVQRWNDFRNMEGTNHQFVWPALVAVGGAGLAIYLTRRPPKVRNIHTSLSKLPPITASPTLLYSILAANVICSATLLYTHQQQKSLVHQSQMDLLSAWEEQATHRAKSRTLALQEHYEAHLISIRDQYEKAKGDIDRRWGAIQNSQAAAVASISATQVAATHSIAAAEKSAWKGANHADAVTRRLQRRVNVLERDREALERRLIKCEDSIRNMRSEQV
jgi:hypothetical protein